MTLVSPFVCILICVKAVPWLRPVFAGAERPRNNPRPVCEICLEKLALGQVFLQILWLYHVSIIPAMLCIRLVIIVA